MGVVCNNWFARVLLSILHVQALMSTDVQTPFLGTLLVPLKSPCPKGGSEKGDLEKKVTLK